MKPWSVGRGRFARSMAYLAGRTVASVAAEDGVRRSMSWLEVAFRKGMLDELESQNINRKVMASMFGVPLRTFQRQLAALRNSPIHAPGQTLWSSLHRRLQTPKEQGEILRGFPTSAHSEVIAVLRDMESTGWLNKTDEGLQAPTAEAPWEEKALREALWAETQLNPTAGAEFWAENLSVSVERIEPLLKEVLETQGDTHSPRNNEAVFNMLAAHWVHQVGLLQRRTGHDITMFQISIERLSEAERKALATDLANLREHARALYERHQTSQTYPRGTRVHRWSVVTAQDTIPFQLEL